MTERWVKQVEKWHKKNPSAMGLLTDDGAVKLLARQHRAVVRMVEKFKKEYANNKEAYKLGKNSFGIMLTTGAMNACDDMLAALAKQGARKKG